MELQITKVTGSAYDGDGVLEVQLELFGAEESSCPPGESYSPYGFRGRPRDPETDADGRVSNGTRALEMREGNTLHAIPLDDLRDTHVPELTKGGSVQYCAVPGAYGLFNGEDGSYDLKVPAGAKVRVQVGSGPTLEMDGVNIKLGGSLPIAMSLGTLTALAAINTWVVAFQAAATIAAPLLAAAMVTPNATLATALLTTAPTTVPSTVPLAI